MNTPPRYQIIEQFHIKLQNGKLCTVSRLWGQRWHCNCSVCNDGFCDPDCKHVQKALAEGIRVEPVVEAIAKAQWRNDAPKLRRRKLIVEPPRKRKPVPLPPIVPDPSVPPRPAFSRFYRAAPASSIR